MMRDILEKNLYLNNILRSVLLKKYNDKVKNFTDIVSKYDSIMEFDKFKEYIDEFKSVYTGGIFSVKKSYSESLLYGHIREMFHYGDLEEKDYFYFPIIEHGIDFYYAVKKNQQSRIFQGDYFLEEWNKAYPGTPTFVVGPYIHYARPYYDEERFKEIKSNVGKTLLVFPTHAYELCEAHYDAKDFVDYVMDVEAKNYQTVMVSAYWADLDHEVYRLFEERGAKLVSAGFRGDPNFIRRLRSMIELSDGVIGNALGTFLGYCIYLKKPVTMIDGKIIMDIGDLDVSNQMFDALKSVENECMKLFAPGEVPFSKAQLDLCEKYWGLSQVKTPEEIRAILSVNKKIIKKAKGNIFGLSKALDKLRKNGQISEMENRLIKDTRSREV